MKKSRPERDEPGTRRPPSFAEYGSDLLALERVKLMSLAERGLLATMRWHVWSNDSLPADPRQMARLLGLEADEVKAALTPAVLTFFTPMKGDPTRLICPELAAQMSRLMVRREKMLQGTLNSHKARREHGKEDVGPHDGTHVGTHGGSGVASELNRKELNRTALGTEEDKRTTLKDDPFVAGYVAEESRLKAEGTGR